MKRHPALIPLSHDHHDGLILAQRIRQGRSRSPRARWPEDRPSQRDRVLEFFQQWFLPHLEAEEAHLFPVALAKLGEPEQQLIRELLDEHGRLRRLAGRLAESEEPGLEPLLLEFAQLLHDHIRREERAFFQALQAQLSDSDLRRCGQAVQDFLRRAGRPDQASCRF